MKVVPVDAKRTDWPRLVADAINRTLRRTDALESASAYTVNTVTFTPIAEPVTPVEGMTYYDSTSNKVRTYDGTIWNDHW